MTAFWDVEIDNILVGAVSDAEYARFLRTSLRDWRVFMRQASSCYFTVVRVVDAYLRTMPIFLFWGMVFYLLHDPTAFLSGVDAIRLASPEALHSGVRYFLFEFSPMFVILLLVADFIFWRWFGCRNMFGCRNAFADATAMSIGTHFGASHGSVVVLRRHQISASRGA
ncbi:MAG: hypothetical protein HQL38_10855 [Alphaproteobacteria bacterium]|nr:hypothetical protein [Alphaproteobacteria bacterium]